MVHFHQIAKHIAINYIKSIFKFNRIGLIIINKVLGKFAKNFSSSTQTTSINTINLRLYSPFGTQSLPQPG